MEKLNNVKKMFALEGIVYTQTKTGYCFKSTDAKDRKGQTINRRISEKTFNEAYEAYLNASIQWEQEVTAKVEEAEEAKEAEDRKVEEQFNGFTREEVNKAVEDAIEKELKKEAELEPAVLNEHGLVVCSGCPLKDECIHHDAMRRNPTEVGGLALCPRLAVKEKKVEKKAKKAAKPRKSKDIAWAGDGINAPHTVTLTTKQVDFIRHLSDSCFWENGVGSSLWTDILCDEIGGQFAGKPMTVGAMISTLCEKGLAERGKDKITDIGTGRTRTATYMVLTELGQRIAKELGLE